jgi:hypothetical protein
MLGKTAADAAPLNRMQIASVEIAIFEVFMNSLHSTGDSAVAFHCVQQRARAIAIRSDVAAGRSICRAVQGLSAQANRGRWLPEENLRYRFLHPRLARLDF